MQSFIVEYDRKSAQTAMPAKPQIRLVSKTKKRKRFCDKPLRKSFPLKLSLFILRVREQAAE